MGRVNLDNVAKTENIVALCDVDWSGQTLKVFETYPAAKRYKDYRLMLDQQKDIDAVIVATSDHTHAVISMESMKRGKHVFTQKPLTHTVYEARALAKAAKEYKVATQMGNQGQASDGPRRLREMIWDGVIGPVREVHVWTDRPNNGLIQNILAPGSVNVLLKHHPFLQNSTGIFLLVRLRCVPIILLIIRLHGEDGGTFGTGALGDIGCHSLDPVFRALKLKYPTTVQAVSTLVNKETYPSGSIVRYEFPARETYASC